MKQLATYSYREESEPEKVKFPLVSILDRYYDSRRLAAIADIIAYSIPAHCLNSRKYRIFMTAADSTANIPLTFKVWDDTPEEKPKLLCVAAVMPLLESGRKKGRQTISHGRSGKPGRSGKCRGPAGTGHGNACCVPGPEWKRRNLRTDSGRGLPACGSGPVVHNGVYDQTAGAACPGCPVCRLAG